MHVAMAAAVRLACMSPFIDVMPLSKWSETSHRVYVYDHEQKAAWRVSELSRDEAPPWPITLLLAWHSKKHVFVNKRKPSLKAVNLGISSIVNSIKWQWTLRGVEKPRFYGFGVKKPTAPCNRAVDPDLQRS